MTASARAFVAARNADRPDILNHIMKVCLTYFWPASIALKRASLARPASRSSVASCWPPIRFRSAPISAMKRIVVGLDSSTTATKAIAWKLGISEHTVKFHLQNIFQKLGAANRTEAARMYHERKGHGSDSRI